MFRSWVRTILYCFCLLSVTSTSLAGGCLPPSTWEQEIVAHEDKGLNHDGSHGGVVYVGSSTIRRWVDIENVLSPLPGLNHGFGGSCMADIVYYFDRIVLPYKPSALVVYSGENDLARGDGKASYRVLDAVVKLAKTAKELLPGLTIYLISIKPTVKRPDLWATVRRANEEIATLSNKFFNVEFINIESHMYRKGGGIRDDLFHPDGIHLNDIGYKMWGNLLRRHIFDKNFI